MKTPKEKTASLFGVQGTGPTVREAKAQAGSKLHALTSHAFEPVVVSHPNYREFAMVFRSGVSSFSYRIFYPAATPPNAGRVYGCSIYDTEQAAIISCRRHLAQVACAVNDDDKSGLEFFNASTSPSYTVQAGARDAREHLGWLAWQREYTQIQRIKPELTGSEIHRLASESNTQMEHVAALKARFGL